ncbi:MAG: biotin--[acetyl-CoA-carboxylase] ligase [Acidimicrobiia bacterium]|nr:biotin--[acetyl-CoA-carboxylase] ligase [Acidimicrobiia bacterium]
MPGSAATPDRTAAVAARLGGTRFADLRWFAQIDSTNRYLLDEARAGAPEGAVAVTDFQTAGRGRLGRSWESPPGASLLVSVLLRPALPLERVHLVTMAAAVALAEAVADVAGFAPDLKWPNDLVVDGRKLAGLLAEADTSGDRPAVVVGAGLNVAWEELPPELAETATACNLEISRRLPADAARVPGREDLLVAYLHRLEGRYRGLEDARAEYRRRLATLGRRVRVELPTGAVTGVAADLGPAGQLLVDADGGARVEVTAGDVVHLRPDPGSPPAP